MTSSRLLVSLLATVIMLSYTMMAAQSESVTTGTAESTVLTRVQTEWAHINYQLPVDQRAAGFERLARETKGWLAAQPGNPEALIWHGIVLSSQAGAQGGLGALSLAKEARSYLEQSLERDPKALQGSAHTSLATLYSKVPGFPIGFGSDKKARAHFDKALAMNPTGIDPNFFYAEYLANDGQKAQALEHLQRALAAPDRPGREAADTGRRTEAQALLKKIKSNE